MGAWLLGVWILFAEAFAQPPMIDLSYQFGPMCESQIGGSCHVYAQTALFEAACFMKTGKRIDVSEEVLFEQHLKQQLVTMGEEALRPDHLINRGEQVISGHVDGSQKTGETLERIHYGQVCTVRNPSPSRNNLNAIRQIVDSLESYSKKKAFQEASKKTLTESKNALLEKSKLEKDLIRLRRLKADLEKDGILTNALSIVSTSYRIYSTETRIDELNTFLNSSLDRVIEHEKTLVRIAGAKAFEKIMHSLEKDLSKIPDSTASRELRNCLKSGLRYEIEKGSNDSKTHPRIMELLRQKRPVLCSGLIRGAGHESIIIGYRKNKKGKIEFLFRDSDAATSQNWWTDFSCHNIAYY